MTRNRIFLILLLLAICAGGWWLYRESLREITNADPEGSRIIAFGDSITAGFQVARGDDYVARLEREFGVDILNAGVPGDTSADGLARFDQMVLQNDPKVVIIGLGGNDILQRVPLEETERNLNEMVRRTQEAGAAVLLFGTDHPMGIGGVADVVKRVAKEQNCAVYPNVLKGIMGNPQLMVDRVHPNAEGHRIIAERLAEILRDEIPSVFD